MIKRIIIICLVVVLAYYAGAKGIKTGDITDWFEESNIVEILSKTFNKTIELAEEKQVAKTTEIIIDELKGKITN